ARSGKKSKQEQKAAAEPREDFSHVFSIDPKVAAAWSAVKKTGKSAADVASSHRPADGFHYRFLVIAMSRAAALTNDWDDYVARVEKEIGIFFPPSAAHVPQEVENFTFLMKVA